MIFLACAPVKKGVSAGDTDSHIIIEAGDNVVDIFQRLSTSPKKVKVIEFSPGDYYIKGSLELPRNNGLLIIEGNGSNLYQSAEVPVFTSMPKDKKEAMVFTHSRFDIRNFGTINGGSKGVELGASLNTIIHNIGFKSQSEAAVDLVFCLMCEVSNVTVTHCEKDGIVLRTGTNVETGEQEWPGAGVNNSQCNHTVLRACRIYAGKGSDTGIKVLQSSGVRVEDCIVEGHDNKRAVYYSAKKCTTAKLFTMKNFHLENNPTEGGICLYSWGTICEVDGFFLQKARSTAPTIWMMRNGNYIFKNIPWWPNEAWFKSPQSPSVVLEQCNNKLYDMKYWKNADKPGEPIYKPYLKFGNALYR